MGESDSFKDHFSGHADAYRRFRPGYPQPMFAYLAARAPDHGLAWDCATGNGQAAQQLARYFECVIATDASEAQIAHATGPDNVRFACASAEASGLDTGSVALITVAQALHWFDFDRFYGEARRVLKPSGILAAWCYGLFTSTSAVDRVVNRLYHDIVGSYWPPERRWIDQHYQTLPFPFPELPAPQFAMRLHWTLDELLGYMNTWSAVQRFQAERSSNPLDSLRGELQRAWPRNSNRLTLTWIMRLRVGRYGRPHE